MPFYQNINTSKNDGFANPVLNVSFFALTITVNLSARCTGSGPSVSTMLLCVFHFNYYALRVRKVFIISSSLQRDLDHRKGVAVDTFWVGRHRGYIRKCLE